MRIASRKDLQKHLSYNPKTGLLHWRIRGFGRQFNRPAGNTDPLGYRGIGFKGRRYLAHRLAWLFMTGKWPRHFIDHRDGNPKNNRFSNLRQATHSQNQQNSTGKRGTIAGLKGVIWVPARCKWQAKIFHGGKQHYLGLCGTPEAAHKAYRAAAIKHFGKFARF